ncbi:MAG: hypothetical protein ACRBB0_21565 [Pelagimonas sp.]|uniref:hypothetical protein n=1 Tax=Pelagimonas sp. TaxID=2073170 RepID=UPI003D6B0AF1
MFTNMDGQSVLAELAKLPNGQRRKTARRLIYKKKQRPSDLGEQLVLLEHLSRDDVLTQFDRYYATIAGAHKICEQTRVDLANSWADKMWADWADVRKMPIAYGLRKDRTHLVFSWINVAMNIDLLRGGKHAGDWADAAFAELDHLNPRQMTPYLFNSNSNIIKVIGIGLLSRPDQLEARFELALSLESYGIEINNPIFWWVFSRFRSPERFKDVKLRAAFNSHRNSMRRIDAMEQACNAAGGDAKRAAFLQVAKLCVAQATPAQQEALLHVVKTQVLT